MIYKIYNIEEEKPIFATSLKELRQLTDATDQQIKQVVCKGQVEFNGYVIIAY